MWKCSKCIKTSHPDNYDDRSCSFYIYYYAFLNHVGSFWEGSFRFQQDIALNSISDCWLLSIANTFQDSAGLKFSVRILKAYYGQTTRVFLVAFGDAHLITFEYICTCTKATFRFSCESPSIVIILWGYLMYLLVSLRFVSGFPWFLWPQHVFTLW